MAAVLAAHSHDLVHAVRAAGDIVRAVSEHVPLKQRGHRLLGLCPFHQEKTPSFSVDPQLGLFYCFGCQAGGDLFSFVMQYEKVEFREAVELLARRWGVPLTSRPDPAEARLRRLLELHEVAAAFFRARLADPEGGARAREYLARRGLSDATVERLGLGYAPDGWEALRGHLAARRCTGEEMVAAGLAIPRRNGSGEIDRFRDRLVFPIRDVSGRTIAFGGRALGADEPKYMNSPETPVYVKGEHLYGLDVAREAIRREGFAVVVEGYMDAAAVLQAGVENVVATLGTSFTAAQARLLARSTRRVVVSYDGDVAGSSAAAKSIDLLLGSGFEVRVLALPDGLDPDDLIRRDGAEAYRRQVLQAPGWLDFLLEQQVRTRDLDRIDERVAAVEALLPHLAGLRSPIERVAWATRVAEALRIEDDLVLQQLRAALRDARPRLASRPAPAAPRVRDVETRLVAVLLGLCRTERAAEVAAAVRDEDLRGTMVAPLCDAILRLARTGDPVDPGAVLAGLPEPHHRELLARIAFEEPDASSPDELESCLHVLRRERLVQERRQLQREIEHAADPAVLESLLLRKQELARRIDALS